MLWRRSNGEELKRLRSACQATITAFLGCQRANSDAPQACTNLETAAMACVAKKGCPEEHKAFSKCVMQAHGGATREGRLIVYADTGACLKQREAMRRCLERKRLWPGVLKAS
jgi:hypothetical protein